MVLSDRRRRRALLLFAGAALLAAVAAVVMLLRPAPPATHPGQVRSTVVSPDGRFRATVYDIKPAFTFSDRTEVTLRPTAGGTEISFGCVVTEDRFPVELRFDAPDALTTDVGGESQTVRFDPQTLRPSEPFGPC